MKQYTAAEKRFFENATVIGAQHVLFAKLSDMGVPVFKLSELAETTSGGTPDRNNSTYYGGDIRWMKSGELTDGQVTEIEETITEEGLANSNAKVFPVGTLLIALYGATVGKTGILSVAAATNQAVCGVTPRRKEVRVRYLFWFLRRKREDFLQTSFGGAQPNISQKILRDTLIPLPSPEIQDAVAGFLDAVEKRLWNKSVSLPEMPTQLVEQRRVVARIEELAAQIREARTLRHQAVEEAEALSYASLRQTRNRLLTSSHSKSRLGNLTKVTSGGTPSRDNAAFWNGDIPWIKTGELLDGDISTAEEHITEPAMENSSAKLFPPDTVLIALYGQGQTRGRTGRLLISATTNQACCAVLPKPEMFDSRFIQFWLRSLYVELREEAQGGAQPNWNGAMIKDLEIALPPLAEQRRIVAELDALQAEVDALKRLQSETAAELDALLPAILDRAFKGDL